MALFQKKKINDFLDSCKNQFSQVSNSEIPVADKISNLIKGKSMNSVPVEKKPPYPYTSMESYQMAKRREAYIYTAPYQKIEDQYYDTISQIETLWSVLYNLKEFNGDKANKFEGVCMKSIDLFKKMYYEYWIPNNTHDLDCVPAYKRLAMLYEKQGRYEDAMLVCMEAIEHGVPNEQGDGNSKRMYARLARMAKKAGLLEDEKVQTFLIGN